MASPVSFTGDFDISFKFWAKTATTQILLGDYTGNNNFVAIIATGTLQVRIGGADIASAAGVVEAKKYYTCRVARVGTAVTLYLSVGGVETEVGSGANSNTFTLDAIGTYNSGALPLNGYMADVDLGTYLWALDEATAATEDSTPTGNAVTYTNIPAGQRHTFTEVSGGEYWWGDNHVRLELDVTQPSAGLYLLAGQSNMLSRATLVGGTDDVYSGLNGKVLQWDYQTSERVGAVNPLNHLNEQPTSMGLWREMCLGLSDPNMLMVPVASDGTSLVVDWAPPLGTNYVHAVDETNAAGTNEPPTTLEAMIWWQGENDADLGRTEPQYLADAHTMRDAMITNIPSMTADTPWVIIEIRAEGASYDAIRAAQATFASEIPNGHLIDTSDLTMFDAYHLDAPSVRTVGTRVAAALEPSVDGGDTHFSRLSGKLNITLSGGLSGGLNGG